MKRLTTHVGRHVTAAVLLVMLVLAGLFGIAEYADELTDAPEGASWLNVVVYVALRLPGILVENLGFGMLVGCLMGLGVLASQSELTVMRASGVSVLGIVWMVLRPMLVLMLLAAALGEFAVPGLNRQAEMYFAGIGQEADQPVVAPVSSSGLWLRHEQDFLHFNTILPSGEIHGFTRLQFSPAMKLEAVVYAPKAAFHEGSWILEQAQFTRFGETTTTTTLEPDMARWTSRLAPELLSVVVSDPDNMSLRDLSGYLGYLDRQAQDGRQFELVFWQKVLRPLGMIGLVLVAISFVFGPLRSTTMGFRLFSGVMVGVLFRFGQDLLGPSSLLFNFSPLLAVAIPITICWFVGLALLARVR